jgi:Cytochrome P450
MCHNTDPAFFGNCRIREQGKHWVLVAVLCVRCDRKDNCEHPIPALNVREAEIDLRQFSYRFGFLDSGVDIMNLMHELDGVNFYCSIAGVFPLLHQIFSKLVQFFKLEGKGLAFVDAYALEHFETRKQEPRKIQEHGAVDFVQKLMNAQTNEEEHVTRSLIRNAAGANMVAGSDTTSISLSAVLYNLYRSPVTLAKLRRELSEHAQAGKISDPITFKEAQSLPYLQAVIKEAIRVHPATGFIMPRVVPVGGVTLSGRYFPQGVSSTTRLVEIPANSTRLW